LYHTLARFCTIEVLFQGRWKKTIGTGDIGSGSGTGDAKEFHQVFSKMGLKLFLAGMNKLLQEVWRVATCVVNQLLEDCTHS